MTEIVESTEYENCLDLKANPDEFKEASLAEFLGIEDDEEDTEEWRRHWVQMPEFEQNDNPPYKKIFVSFRTKEDYDEFAALIGQNLTEKTKSIWHPKLDRDENTLKRWIEDGA